MKANKDFRPISKDSIYESDDSKKGKKLTPDKKPKNERLYDVDDFEETYDLQKYKRESITDFYDDGLENEDIDDEEYDEEEYDEDEIEDNDNEEFENEEFEEDEVNTRI